MLTIRQAAAALGISGPRVQQLITAGRLPAVKFGNAWAVDPADLEKVRDRPTGRPVVTGEWVGYQADLRARKEAAGASWDGRSHKAAGAPCGNPSTGKTFAALQNLPEVSVDAE